MIKYITQQYIKPFLSIFRRLLKIKMACSTEDYIEEVICETSDILENHPKTFKLGEGEILLIKQNNVISALGSRCTHYGGPLVNGALGNGRIRCPWHGACFDLTTGDIEDFPGLDSLPCYKVTVDGENVKVRASIADLRHNKRKKNMVKRNRVSNDSVVVIGGGPAAAVCVETLRQELYDGRITMICQEKYLPYDRTKCTKQMDFTICDGQLRNGPFYHSHDIDIMKSVEAVSVNTKTKTVKLSNNKTLQYTKLFIATGNSPKRIAVKGEDLKNIFLLRNYDHSKILYSALSKDKRMVVIGGGFIGMEVADFCADKVKKITLVMRYDKPLKYVFGNEIGGVLMKLFTKKGIEFVPNVNVVNFIGCDKVESVNLSDGSSLPADLVVIGVGVEPNSAFLENSGIHLKSDGTIITNSRLETNVPNVFAGGDVACAPIWSHNNEKASVGHFALAHYHGRIAGLNIAGKETELRSIPFFWTKMAGYSIRYCGFGNFDHIVDAAGSYEEMKFLFIYLKNEKVVAMSSCNMDPYVSKFAELVQQGKHLTRADVCPCDGILKWAS
ncbi:unnamed protein product [Phyllotreta striolata]|uniref:Rieske domain-containing protein n=1 Tax=Phyllotreta striolata TaxID=444603 RepID=A0A9P0GNQ9_PHYSR|nr:unnamed protein product [Phyllotreta striolata]